MIGVLVFLLFVLLMYLAAPSPSTAKLLSRYQYKESQANSTHEQAYEGPSGYSQILRDKVLLALERRYSVPYRRTDVTHRDTDRFRAIRDYYTSTSKPNQQRFYHLSCNRVVLRQQARDGTVTWVWSLSQINGMNG
jgi:hypothetical protein